MIQRIRTENSIYEIDVDNKLVRRVYGVNSTTTYTGRDGVWKSYHSAGVVNGLLTIIWQYSPDKGAFETTTTSAVQEITEVENTPGQYIKGEDQLREITGH